MCVFVRTITPREQEGCKQQLWGVKTLQNINSQSLSVSSSTHDNQSHLSVFWGQWNLNIQLQWILKGLSGKSVTTFQRFNAIAANYSSTSHATQRCPDTGGRCRELLFIITVGIVIVVIIITTTTTTTTNNTTTIIIIMIMLMTMFVFVVANMFIILFFIALWPSLSVSHVLPQGSRRVSSWIFPLQPPNTGFPIKTSQAPRLMWEGTSCAFFFGETHPEIPWKPRDFEVKTHGFSCRGSCWTSQVLGHVGDMNGKDHWPNLVNLRYLPGNRYIS